MVKFSHWMKTAHTHWILWRKDFRGILLMSIRMKPWCQSSQENLNTHKMKSFWRIWAKALGEKASVDNCEANKVAFIRTIIILWSITTNAFIIANVIRHWWWTADILRTILIGAIFLIHWNHVMRKWMNTRSICLMAGHCCLVPHTNCLICVMLP